MKKPFPKKRTVPAKPKAIDTAPLESFDELPKRALARINKEMQRLQAQESPPAADIRDGEELQRRVNLALNNSLLPGSFFIAPGRKGHLIEDYMLGPGHVTTIVAASGTGKTTLVMDLILSVALKGISAKARAFLGQRVMMPPRPIVYFAKEGHRQIQLLGAAFAELTSTSLDDPEHYAPIIVPADSFNVKLNKPDDFKRLCEYLDGIQFIFGSPGIIVFDTTRKHLRGAENDSDAPSDYLLNAHDIAVKYDCVVLSLSHTSKKDDGTARGSGAWLADTDGEWYLKRMKGGTIKLEVTKIKGFPTPPPLYFTIEDLETDFEDLDNGKPLRAAYIKQASAPKSSARTNGNASLGENATKTLLARTPEQKHAARQESRLELMHAAWSQLGGDERVNNAPYITRAALAEYLATNLGYSESTIKQAMKPTADATKAASIIGPLLTDNLIEKHAHGWIIVESQKDAS